MGTNQVKTFAGGRVMSRIRLVPVALALVTLAAFAMDGGKVVHAVSNAVQNVIVTNTPASPVPIAGTVAVSNLPGTQTVSATVNVGHLPATQVVSGTVNVGNFPANATPPAATQTFSIPVQSTLAGTNYTFGGVFTTASLLTIVTHDPIEVTFNGPAPVLVGTSSPQTLALTQRVQVDSVNVACMASSGSCYFRF